MSDFSINSNNTGVIKNTPVPAAKNTVVEAVKNTEPVKAGEKLALSRELSKGISLRLPTTSVQLFDDAASHNYSSAGSKSYRMLMTDAVVNHPATLKEFTINAAKHGDNALGRVIIETAAFYPGKLEEVLKVSAGHDYFQMKSVVGKVYDAAAKHGVTVEKFPTANITKTLALNSAKKIINAGIIGVPLDMALNIFDYNSGKTDARTYSAKTLNGFFSWSAFEAGLIGSTAIASTIIGKKIGPLGHMVAGVGTGMITSSLYHKTIGHNVEEKIKANISEKGAEKFAEAINKYFGKPVDAYLLQPIKNNPKTSLAVGGVIATVLTIKYPVAFGRNILLGLSGATAVGVAGHIGMDMALGKTVNKPSKNVSLPLTSVELREALKIEERYKTDSSSVTDAEAVKYNEVLQRFEKLDEPSKAKILDELH